MKNRFLFQFRYDLKEGIQRQAAKYIAVFLFLLFLTLKDCLIFREAGIALRLSVRELSLTDCFVCAFGGMQFFYISYQININWIIIYLYLAFMISYFPFRDLKGFGQQLILRSGKVGSWWASKCLWTVTVTVVYHLVAYLAIAVSVLICGSFDLAPHPENIALLKDLFMTKPYTAESVQQFVLLLPIIAASMYLIVLFVSLVTRPIGGLIVCILLIGLTIFSEIGLLPPWQAMMILRTEVVHSFPGTATLWLNAGTSIAFSLLVILAGSVCIRRKDIL